MSTVGICLGPKYDKKLLKSFIAVAFDLVPN
jgi:hypothetical protein